MLLMTEVENIIQKYNGSIKDFKKDEIIKKIKERSKKFYLIINTSIIY